MIALSNNTNISSGNFTKEICTTSHHRGLALSVDTKVSFLEKVPIRRLGKRFSMLQLFQNRLSTCSRKCHGSFCHCSAIKKMCWNTAVDYLKPLTINARMRACLTQSCVINLTLRRAIKNTWPDCQAVRLQDALLNISFCASCIRPEFLSEAEHLAQSVWTNFNSLPSISCFSYVFFPILFH